LISSLEAGRLSAPEKIMAHAWPEGTVPVVSVCCYTYNQNHLLADALEGFLAQETDFPVEIVVQDDASTDGTDKLIRRYAADHPRLFRPVFHAENSRSRGMSPMLSCLGHCRGEFIAMCEGDDYWTDPRKLQLQVEFLRANTDCVGCIHDAKVIDGKGKTLMESCINRQAGRYTRRDCIEWLHSGYPTASLVFRRWAIRELPRYDESRPRDVTLDIAITGHGDLGVLDACMSVYRKHPGGVWTCASRLERHLNDYDLWNTVSRDASLTAEYGALIEKNIRRSRAKLKHAAGEISAVHRSFSWRITRPLRSVRRLFDSTDAGTG